MDIKALHFNALRVCCYILWDETGECVIIDPGFSCENEFQRMKNLVGEKKLKPVKVILTHCHFDHVLGLEDCCSYWGIDAYYNQRDEEQLLRASRYSTMLGIDTKEFTGVSHNIDDGDKIEFGNTVLEVIATPGHSRGGLCFYNRKEAVIFSGDTLFAGSIGRTDHLGGNLDQILESINNKLMTLDGDTLVYPGHGSRTDIAYERATNPFLRM